MSDNKKNTVAKTSKSAKFQKAGRKSPATNDVGRSAVEIANQDTVTVDDAEAIVALAADDKTNEAAKAIPSMTAPDHVEQHGMFETIVNKAEAVASSIDATAAKVTTQVNEAATVAADAASNFGAFASDKAHVLKSTGDQAVESMRGIGETIITDTKSAFTLGMDTAVDLKDSVTDGLYFGAEKVSEAQVAVSDSAREWSAAAGSQATAAKEQATANKDALLAEIAEQQDTATTAFKENVAEPINETAREWSAAADDQATSIKEQVTANKDMLLAEGAKLKENIATALNNFNEKVADANKEKAEVS